MAVPVLAMLLLLLTAAAVSTAPDGRGRLRAFFMMICVLSQINLACLFARKAARARTLATRRFYAVGAVACFVEVVLRLYMILVLVSLCALSLFSYCSCFGLIWALMNLLSSFSSVPRGCGGWCLGAPRMCGFACRRIEDG